MPARCAAATPKRRRVTCAFDRARQQLCEQALAVHERRPAQIEPVEIEKVEGVVEQPDLAARGEVGVQQPEIGDAAQIHNDGLAIQDQVRCREGCERIGDRLKAQRPIIACARLD